VGRPSASGTRGISWRSCQRKMSVVYNAARDVLRGAASEGMLVLVLVLVLVLIASPLGCSMTREENRPAERSPTTTSERPVYVSDPSQRSAFHTCQRWLARSTSKGRVKMNASPLIQPTSVPAKCQ
jgi:hypothetical protein